MLTAERYARIRELLFRGAATRRGYWSLAWTANHTWEIRRVSMKGHKEVVGTLGSEATWRDALGIVAGVLAVHPERVSPESLYDLVKLLQALINAIEISAG